MSAGLLPGNSFEQATHTHVPLVTKHYNMVPASGQWCSSAGKVTTGLAKSNGSLSPGRWLPLHQDQLWAQHLVVSMGEHLPKVLKHTTLLNPLTW